MREAVNWYDDSTEHPPWIKALAEVRHLAAREGWCYRMFKRSLSQSTNMQKLRQATGISS
jgi:hypothetical protein